MSDYSNSILNALRKVLVDKETQYNLHEPFFNGNEVKYVSDCVNSGWVSSVGEYVERFEQQISEFTNIPYAVAVVNGTSALQIALILAEVIEKDEVLVPALSFVATANAVSYLRATPHFVDCDEDTLGIDPIRLREYLNVIIDMENGDSINRLTGNRVKAMIPMHTYGHPSKLDELLSISKDFNLTIVEDAAESIGSYYKNKHTGGFGRCGIFSFNGNKTITTGGGGAIITNDLELSKKAKHLTTTAKVNHKWEFMHDEVGYNYRLPNINAALGCAQLEKISEMLVSKRKLAMRYKEAFDGVADVKFISEPENCKSNYWLNTIRIDAVSENEKKILLEETNKANIMTRPCWKLLNELNMYRECPSMDLTVSKKLEKTLINIPSSASITLE